MAKPNIDGPELQNELVAAMLRPEFYPQAHAEVIHKETHISHVFLVGALVYKIKKPVRFSFLDFSTLARRRHFLQEELRLNRRLAPSVYLAVMPIALDQNGWRLGGWSEPAEYTLVMRRLPERRMLRFLLQTQQVSAPMMEQLANHLGDFHAAAEIIRDGSAADYLAGLQAQWRENVTDIAPLIADRGERSALAAIDAFGSGFLREHGDLLARRFSEGWIRDVHGDLHAEHICFAPEGIQIFDCIEFSAKLRHCDLASEISFLLMDVTILGGAPLIRPLIARYCERVGDSEMKRLLPYFQCYRAMVRAKVHALRWGRWNPEAGRYLRYARRMSWESVRPFLLLVCGLSGSGKSSFARPLGERLGMTVINSDIVRKQLAAKPGRQAASYRQGIYSPAMTDKTYAAMARQAEELIRGGEGAIVDATFGRRDHRDQFAALAANHGVPMAVIHCSVPEAVAEKRLSRRAARGADVSDADWKVYLAQKAAYQPLDEVPQSRLVELRTEAPLDQLLDEGEALLWSSLSGR